MTFANLIVRHRTRRPAWTPMMNVGVALICPRLAERECAWIFAWYLLVVDALIELRRIEPELAAELLHELVGIVRRLAVPLILRRVQRVVEFPELALLVGARCGARRLPRVAVDRRAG